MKQSASNITELQACITTVSFPATEDELVAMIEKNGAYNTDLEALLFENSEGEPEEILWSSPRWLVKGDLLFFYHTKSALKNAQRLLALARQGTDQDLIALLEDAVANAEQFGGTIFGFATITAPAEYLGQQEEAHFKGRIFAPIDNIHIFDNPIDADQFGQVVKISQGTITTLDKKAFDGLKKLLSTTNDLPDHLLQAEFSAVGFRDINKSNWLTISTGKNVRFIHEAQVREYFIDYLLNEIKDPRTQLHEECQCWRNGQKTGIADYFVSVGGHWLPVEAKLNIRSEKDILAQIRQYIQVDVFSPTRNNSTGEKIKASRSSLCLVVDNSGIYLTNHGRFTDCELEKPRWLRTELRSQTMSEIRDLLKKFIK